MTMNPAIARKLTYVTVALWATIMTFVFVGGCSRGDEAMTRTKDIQTRCLDGVVYYLFSETSGYKGFGYMAPKLRADGSLVACD